MDDELNVQIECKRNLLAIEREIADILATHANTLKRANPKVSERSSVLYGAICKLQEASRAVRLLGEHGFVDEMNALLRTQVELTVNVCYLQNATDEEVLSYLHHDPIAGYIALQDIIKASGGTVAVPPDLRSRVSKQAQEASDLTGLKITSRQWDKKNIKQKADIVDAKMGMTDFAGMLATVYVTGSGYVHGSYKTVHKHARYLMTGEEEYPWHVMFGANNVIHGMGYVQLVFARYLSKMFDLPYDRLNALAADGQFICDVASTDYRLHRSSKGSSRYRKSEKNS